MFTLPIEIRREICALSCTDGGLTGRSLSLVSHMFHDISVEYKLQSIALFGSTQLDAFLQVLHAHPPHLRRVRNLLITGNGKPTEELEGEEFQDDNTFAVISRDTLCQLLEITSPSLQTLTVATHMSPFIHKEAFCIPTALPSLVELTLLGSMNHPSHRKYASFVAGGLRRLHVACDIRSPLRSKLARSLTRIAPNLTHLRFSNLESLGGFGTLKHDLSQAVSFWNDRETPQNARERWFATLQMVAIQRAPFSNPFFEVFPDHDGEYTQDTRFLEDLVEKDSSGKLIVLPLDSRTFKGRWDSRPSRKLRDAWGQWLDRCEGGAGCWDLGGPEGEGGALHLRTTL